MIRATTRKASEVVTFNNASDYRAIELTE